MRSIFELVVVTAGRVTREMRRRYLLGKPIKDRLSVTFDDACVTVKDTQGLDEAWNQAFYWKDVRQVCVKDGGMMGSDLINISVTGSEAWVVVPMEAEGGGAFYQSVRARGLFPDEVAAKAVRETDGRTYCWPPDKD